jgi:signal transduction histidine kinase
MPDPTGHSNQHDLSHHEVAVLAHEVRGALTVIVGFTELMRRPLPDKDRVAALDGIARAVQRIDRLVAAALEGEVAVARPGQRIRLATLASSVAAEQQAISGRAVEVHVERDPIVLGMPEALERAVGNLVGNALKYSLRDSVVEITVAEEDGVGVLSVADRGPGIPAEDRERILEPFERLATHADVPGTGLGLTVVRSVVEGHGGAVRILDRPGGGAIVRLELPLVVPRART